MRARAAVGDPSFAAHLADGHDLAYLRDIDYVTRHRERFGR